MRLARPVAGGLLVACSVALVVLGTYRPEEQGPAVTLVASTLAALLAGIVASVAVIRPWWGLLCFIAAAPIINVARAQLWVAGIQLIPATFLLAALGVGILLRRHPSATGAAGQPARATWATLATWGALALGGALAVASSLAAHTPIAAANITLHGVVEPMAAFAVVVALRPGAHQALHALLALAAGVAMATAINLAWLLLVVAPTDLYEQRMQLARLTYFNVGIYASMLVVAIPAAATVLLVERRRRWGGPGRAVAWLTIGLFVVALFLTYTKSAWLSAALVCALLILLLVRTWRARTGLLLAVAVVLAVGVPYPLAVLRAALPDAAAAYESFLGSLQGSGRLESWDPDTYEGSGSIGIRVEAIGAAAEMTASSPLLGVGPGEFAREFARIRPASNVPGLQSAHNMLPNLAAEYGLPFALLVGIGLVVVIGSCLSVARRLTGDARVVATVIGVALIGFLAMASLFGVDLYRAYRTMNTDVVTAALLAGLAWSAATAWREPRDRRSAWG
jgi:hypothetical protein